MVHCLERSIYVKGITGGLIGIDHPGVLVAKVGYFGVKSAKVPPGQMGTKPAKVGHLAANLLKYVQTKNKKSAPRGFEPGSNDGILRQSRRFAVSLRRVVGRKHLERGFFLFLLYSHKKVFAPRAKPNVLKWGVPGRGSNLLKCGRLLTSRTPG